GLLLLWTCTRCPHRTISTNSVLFFFFSSRRRHTRFSRDWSSDVCSSDLASRSALMQAAAFSILKPMRPASHDSSLRANCSLFIQIGRASCRERGWSPVGDRSLEGTLPPWHPHT